MSNVRVDHVIYAVADLDEGASRFRQEFGLDSIAGGRHPAWGTANRIVPLGHEYVELVAVVDREQAATAPFGAAVMTALAAGRPLLGWAVATRELRSVAERLSLDVTPGVRRRPDGSVLRWELAGVAPALRSGALPFFIQWEVRPEEHPGAAAVEHAVKPRRIASIDLAVGVDTLAAWLGQHALPLRITSGPEALSAVTIATAGSEIVLR